jgi:hypothetical protein
MRDASVMTWGTRDGATLARRAGRALAVGAVVLGLLFGALGAHAGRTSAASSALPPLPARWPSTHLELGLSSSPGDAAALRASAPFGFRYQYLAGGVNTGNGWATWNTNGAFVTYYISDSVSHGVVPVFPYYMLLQSNPQTNLGEAGQDLAHLRDATVMRAYWADVRLFFQKAAGSSPVVLHVEPDLWGYVEQAASNDDGATVPAKVGSLGIAELAGLPDTAAGFAQAFVRLRDALAPNVILAYHISDWGTGIDLHYSQTSDATTDSLAAKAGRFYNSLGAGFDVAFADIADRDAAFKQLVYGDGGASWWNSTDFPRYARFYAGFTAATAKRTVIWQIPLGNTKMRALNNTWGHYQDNRAEWFLDDPTGTHLALFRDSGVIAFLFGGGASGTTCACDAIGDGITNPAAINGNTMGSLTADDDGGYFRWRAATYYGAPLTLDGAGPNPTPTPSPSGTPTPTPSPTPTPVATPSPTPTATPTPTPAPVTWTTSATVSPTKVKAGSGASFTVTTSVRASAATTALVDIELYDPKGVLVQQTFWDSQAFAPGVTRTFGVAWTAPTGPTGWYTVKVGVFAPGWGPMLAWSNNAARLSVTKR